MLDLQSNILERLRAKLDLDKIPIERLHEEDLWQRAERATIDLVETLETSGELPKYIDQDTLIKETLNEALALGPLEDLLADEKIDEIIIDRRDRVVVGKDGQLRGSGKAFSSDDVFERVVKRLVAEAGAHDRRERARSSISACATARGSPPRSRRSRRAARASCSRRRRRRCRSSPSSVAQNALSPRHGRLPRAPASPRAATSSCAAARARARPRSSARSPRRRRRASASSRSRRSRSSRSRATSGSSSRRAPATARRTTSTSATCSRPRCGSCRIASSSARCAAARRCRSSSALCASIDGAIVAMTGEGANAALGRLVDAGAARDARGDRRRDPRARRAGVRDRRPRRARGRTARSRVLSIEEIVGCSDTAFDTHVLFQFRDGNFVATGEVPRFYAELEARGIPADQAVFTAEPALALDRCSTRRASSRTSRSRGHTARSSSRSPSPRLGVAAPRATRARPRAGRA